MALYWTFCPAVSLLVAIRVSRHWRYYALSAAIGEARVPPSAAVVNVVWYECPILWVNCLRATAICCAFILCIRNEEVGIADESTGYIISGGPQFTVFSLCW